MTAPDGVVDATARSEAEIARELKLRGAPPPVTRLSRKVLVGGVAVAALLVAGSTWWALQNGPAKRAVEPEASAAPPTPPEALTALPKDYAQAGAASLLAGVPKLGTPLPGDLGRPIVAAGGAGALGGQTLGPAPPGAASGQAASPPVDPAVQQARHAVEAARASRLFAASAPSGTAETSALPPSTSTALNPTSPGTEATAAPADHKLAFLARDGSAHAAVSQARLTPPASPYLVQAGTLIDAALITGVRSDLPGQLTAQVTADVHDSVTGRWLLIPQGSRLIGTYDAQVSFGQSRVLLVWTRLILPNGRSLDLGRAPGEDRFGYAGLQDRVDRHWRSLFGAAALSTVLAVGSDVGSSSTESDLMQALRRGTSDTLNRAGEEAVRRQLDVSPTLTIRPGHPVKVVVEHDLVLEPYVKEGRG